MESHAVYVSQEVFADFIARVIAGPHREFDAQRRQFIGHVATFSDSRIFVSPTTALVKFNADDHLAKPKANNMSLELGPSQRKSAASMYQLLAALIRSATISAIKMTVGLIATDGVSGMIEASPA
jgi:hypothetical protein